MPSTVIDAKAIETRKKDQSHLPTQLNSFSGYESLTVGVVSSSSMLDLCTPRFRVEHIYMIVV